MANDFHYMNPRRNFPGRIVVTACGLKVHDISLPHPTTGPTALCTNELSKVTCAACKVAVVTENLTGGSGVL